MLLGFLILVGGIVALGLLGMGFLMVTRSSSTSENPVIESYEGEVEINPSTQATAVDPTVVLTAPFVEQFAAANGGISPQLVGRRPAQFPLAQEEVLFDLNGENIVLFVYDDPAGRETISQRIAPDGSGYGYIDSQAKLVEEKFDLDNYPHFWFWEQYIIQYIGNDGPTFEQLTNSFGSTDAAGAFYDTELEMLTASEWVFVDWGTVEKGNAAVPNITRVQFVDGMMTGTTGVNNFGVPFSLADEEPYFRLNLDEFVITEALSEDPAVNAQERLFLEGLRSATHIAVGPTVMRISYGDGFSLGFEAVPTKP